MGYFAGAVTDLQTLGLRLYPPVRLNNREAV